MSTERPAPASFIKHAADVASFYGFRPVREIERAVPRVDRLRGSHSFATTLQLGTAYLAQKPQEPVLTFYASPAPTHVPEQLGKLVGEFGLQVVGAPESLGEILLLKTLAAILGEWGATVARVRVNALGDRDSKARFERELVGYLRKHAQSLDEGCRTNTTHEPTAVYTCQNETCRTLLSDGPRAVNYLSEKSRTHFREVLEHIEELGLPYELDDLLVGDEREARIAFAMDLAQEDATVLAVHGGRFDEYVRKLTGKKEGSAVSASIHFRRKGADRSNFTTLPATSQPKVYFVQLGTRAKLQGLAVLDLLRQAGVPVGQSFDARNLGLQLASARALGVPYLLIMGQREALDGTIIVRSTRNSSQEIVPLSSLPRFLKSLK